VTLYLFTTRSPDPLSVGLEVALRQHSEALRGSCLHTRIPPHCMHTACYKCIVLLYNLNTITK
jgi:hypothetical protein